MLGRIRPKRKSITPTYTMLYNANREEYIESLTDKVKEELYEYLQKVVPEHCDECVCFRVDFESGDYAETCSLGTKPCREKRPSDCKLIARNKEKKEIGRWNT